ncbi:hypothetical protein QSV34_08045 [Porticoccus sp. W117]|uniref:hypothetical protein n=1 Tax=Porticoccus sp. W117 TaxID=3054777 RepID=UPI002598AFFE|nr:hypothetical protein [Porticoccus sp. W117]MDM3871304.1 hypothetical protein [Porticoccus sp. W117]
MKNTIFPAYFSTQLPLHIAGLLSALAYAYLSLSSQSEGSVTLWQLWGVSLLCAALCFLAWRHYDTDKKLCIKAVIAWALLFRLIGVTSFPVMEDDFYRFLWDGRMLVESGSPYSHPPSEFFGASNLSDADEATLDGINHPDIKTVYGPLNQYMFAFSHLIAANKIWPLQLLFTLLDMVLILLLIKLAPIRSVLLYAWCPLAIKEFAFTAHPDIVALLPLVAALVTTKKQQWNYTALWLALAVAGKVFALILVPLLLRFRWRSWLVFAGVLTAIWLPIGGGQLPQGLTAMAENWQFNAPIYQLLGTTVGPSLLKMILLSAFCLLWAAYAWQHLQKPADTLPRGDWLFGLLLLFSPVFNPWYALWILPFAVIWPSRWAWTTSLAVLLAYASGINMPNSGLGLYQQPGWAVVLEFGLVALALLWDWRKTKAST